MALLVFVNGQFNRNWLNWYISLGAAYRHTERHWTVSGIYNNQIAVDFTANFTRFKPMLSLGLKIDILNF
mgnify:CR=1 FL=1